MNTEKFIHDISQGYQCQENFINLGVAKLNGKVLPEAKINIPLNTLNRHGLIAGATGTGKTKTIQLLAERLSTQGVPTLLMDLKGDLSGLAASGKNSNAIEQRQKLIGEAYQAESFPVEFLTLSTEPGLKLRATVSEFGPILFSQILELNDTQRSIVAIVFKYSDDNHLPLLDLKDFKKVLQFITHEIKDDIEKTYGNISTPSASTILRKVIELEQQGGDLFFGEPSFEVEDLLQTTSKQRGIISILRLIDLQNRPKLFSSFMLCLLAEIYQKFPELGDVVKPKLVIFIDEAHLLFKQASKPLLDQIESIIKLIRSKGVGIFFCTQNPADIPDAILGQLGLKIQHALRAFTAKDRKSIKLTAENYPLSVYYKTDELLTSLGIGEAAITALNKKGIPTPLAATFLNAPHSRMGPLTETEINTLVNNSLLANRYNHSIDRDSAYEQLLRKLKQAESSEKIDKKENTKKRSQHADNLFESLSKNTMVRQLGRTLMREITRGLLGILKK